MNEQKSKFIEWRCWKCRRLLVKIEEKKDNLGWTEVVCHNSRCKARNPILLYGDKVYLISEDFLDKHKRILKSLTPELRKLIMKSRLEK